jgi:hypothetical protein
MITLRANSNIDRLTTEMKGLGGGFFDNVDEGVKAAAMEFMRDCIIEIDSMIYSQPGSTYGMRTKFLRRSHHLRQVVKGVYMVFNDADYALPQHDGWHDRGGGFHAGRPWMDSAAEKNRDKYKGIISDVLGRWFG